MKKIKTVFNIFKTLLTNPGRVRAVIDHEKEYFNYIKKHYPEFKDGLPVIDFNQLADIINTPVEPYTFLDGNSLVTDMVLLKSLAKRFSNTCYFEIGTWRGESVATISSVASKCVTLNLPDETMLNLKLPKEYVSLHRFFSKNLHNVTHLQYDSQTFDYSSYRQQFDLVFVDGDHHYENVKNDTRNVFQLLRNKQSIIVWHDYAHHPEEIRYEVLAGILDGCPAGERLFLYHVSDTKCAVLIRERLPSHQLKRFGSPSSVFSVQLTLKAATKGD